ncbi:hypothetical protein DL766_008818 [Monosporascus sp. MC13-8B]|uniref:MARVEL domain-containing protein n=1 Tax=Monosporascus cannonballus TaxID=155416 RepID=A0ABY0GSY3_9PEZI|nr:hypothetical protein DL762_009835 [Monosporascus cannonballus]RYO89740.1 hypothetical protein DL763_005542 [Monosporascus cannonballus]RYP17799.1 hypothetical protein DL766_008818 [Monosporascus sp. MC13-8B]
MALNLVSIALIVAAVFSIVELALTAYIANAVGWGLWRRGIPRVNFMVFNSVWSLLVLAYVGLSPLYFPRLSHKLVATGLNCVTAIFWFAGSIALAVWAGVGVWGAAVAFGFFLWAIFTFLGVLGVLEARGTNSTVKTPGTAPAGV